MCTHHTPIMCYCTPYVLCTPLTGFWFWLIEVPHHSQSNYWHLTCSITCYMHQLCAMHYVFPLQTMHTPNMLCIPIISYVHPIHTMCTPYTLHAPLHATCTPYKILVGWGSLPQSSYWHYALHAAITYYKLYVPLTGYWLVEAMLWVTCTHDGLFFIFILPPPHHLKLYMQPE